MNAADDPLEMICRYQEGNATAEEVQQLEQRLQSDSQFRADYLAYTRLDAALVVATRRAPPAQPPATKTWAIGWRFWRSATSAAAGLLVGVLSASMAWAFAIPQSSSPAPRTVPIYTESFESETVDPRRGFPVQAGVWSGDISDSIQAENGVTPKTGVRMIRLQPHAVRKFSYATRIIDLADYPLLPGESVRRIEVEASFHDGPSNLACRHQIRLAAFAEEAPDVRQVWNSSDMFDRVLLHVGLTTPVEAGATEWHTLRSSMEIPAGARSLVISVAAGSKEDDAPKVERYLDDLNARFVLLSAD